MDSRIARVCMWIFIVLMVWCLPPLLPGVLLSAEEIMDVAQTGMCPPAPTDIPAYPCSVIEFIVTRVIFNPWAFVLH
ncbi:MAG: hypothetical protein AAFS10_12655, partial [Myxococcota bacterium]